MLSNFPVKTRRFDNTFRNLIISNLIGQFNLFMVEVYIIMCVHVCMFVYTRMCMYINVIMCNIKIIYTVCVCVFMC